MTLTLVVFGVAVLLWVCTPLDDTFVALAAVAVLLLFGVLPASALDALGSSTTWLLIAAFVLAAGVTASGLPARMATWLVGRARTVRGLAHLTAFALLLTAFFVPSTSGRAALTLPVFEELRPRLNSRVTRALGVLFPSVILLTAVSTVVGAGAHLITNSLLETATGQGIGFGWWLLLGVPLALVSAHVTAEIVLWLFTTHKDRAQPLHVDAPTVRFAAGGTTLVLTRARLTRAETIALATVATVSIGWLTEPLHHVRPEVIALVGAVVITAPRVGTTTMKKAFGDIPWSLLLFMAATTILGTALIDSGAAGLLAGLVDPARLLPTVIVVSLLAHLAIQSRSARSSVLIPIVIPLALAAGMNPAALAFASTAAAGFCHTLTSSAKPVALFADAYRPSDLLKLSALLAPATGLLVYAAAVHVWPHLGLPLH